MIPRGTSSEVDSLRTIIVKEIKFNYLKYLERIVREEAALQSKRKGIEKESLELLAKYFFVPGMWDPLFGSEPWGKIAMALVNLNKSINEIEDIEIIDHIHDLEHNTATVMNRCLDSQTFSGWLNFKAKATPEQLSKRCSIEVKKFLDTFGVSKVVKEIESLTDFSYVVAEQVIKDNINDYNPSDKKLLEKLLINVTSKESLKKNFSKDEIKQVRIIVRSLSKASAEFFGETDLRTLEFQKIINHL